MEFSPQDIEDLGFSRKEMHSEDLAGGIDMFDLHIFVAFGSRDTWPEKIEAHDNVVTRLSRKIKAAKDDLPLKIKVTACEAVGDANEGDILLFPQYMRFRGAASSDVAIDSFIADVLKSGSQEGGETLQGGFVFVCSHLQRDKRCGYCGPVLMESISSAAAAVQNDDIHVLGGHKYAGNVIVFPVNQSYGDWFGYVCPTDSAALAKIAQGGDMTELAHLWRGRMGVSPEKHIAIAKEARQRRGPMQSNACAAAKGKDTMGDVSEKGTGQADKGTLMVVGAAVVCAVILGVLIARRR